MTHIVNGGMIITDESNASSLLPSSLWPAKAITGLWCSGNTGDYILTTEVRILLSPTKITIKKGGLKNANANGN